MVIVSLEILGRKLKKIKEDRKENLRKTQKFKNTGQKQKILEQNQKHSNKTQITRTKIEISRINTKFLK